VTRSPRHAPEGASTRRRIGPGAPSDRIWLFTALLSVIGWVLFHFLVRSSGPFFTRSWGWAGLLLVAVLFFGTEVFAVDLHFTRNAHSLTLFEIPLVMGLFFVAPRPLILLHLFGSGAALVVHRRLAPIKLFFNLMSFLVSDAVAIVAFRAVGGSAGHFGIVGILAAFVATPAASTLSFLLVFGVISFTERTVDRSWLVSTVSFGVMSALFSTSLGLIAVAVISAYPGAAWLLIIPSAGMYFANSAYASERRRHEGLEFLYDSTRILHQSPEVEGALGQLLLRTRAIFHSEFAELAYRATDGEHTMNASIPAGVDTATVHVGDDASLDPLWDLLTADPSTVIVRSERATPELAAVLASRGIDNAIVTPLRSEDRVAGLVIVGNGKGSLGRFDAEDHRLIETLANHVVVALENGRLEHSLDQLRRLERQLSHQATHDPLTELANRVLFTQLVTDALAAPDATGPTAVFFVDLDDFKTVNDSLGHAAGDDLLTVVGRRLRTSIPARGTAARLGGDEFAVALPDCAGRREAERLAQDLLVALGEPVSIAGRTMPVNASIGIALSEPGHAAADVLRNADTAMYAAKGRGKRCHAMFEGSMHAAAVHRYQLTADLRRAVDHDQFVVHYQPVVDMATGAATGAEALVRWRHPTLGLLRPAAFIALAEETGTSRQIAGIVLDEVCDFAEQMLAIGDCGPVRIAVNLSARDLADPTLAGNLGSIITAHAISPTNIVFEITETAMLSEPEKALATLRDLKALGVQLALDDFGTGYSSLSHLCRLPVDVLKIAQPFVDDLGTPDQPIGFLQAIVHLGESLGLRVVAEGVERAVQADLLLALGCRLGQGDHFSPPMPAGELVPWLQARRHLAVSQLAGPIRP
jgi:diguanylate cyclase (GGDEF)-like protein